MTLKYFFFKYTFVFFFFQVHSTSKIFRPFGHSIFAPMRYYAYYFPQRPRYTFTVPAPKLRPRRARAHLRRTGPENFSSLHNLAGGWDEYTGRSDLRRLHVLRAHRCVNHAQFLHN